MRAVERLPGFGFDGRIGRLAYLGMVTGTALCALLAGSVLIRPHGAADPVAVPAALAGFLTSAAIFWAILCLSARRLRDAGLSAWWCLFPLVTVFAVAPLAAVAGDSVRPVVTGALNGCFMLALCLLPSRPAAAGGRQAPGASTASAEA